MVSDDNISVSLSYWDTKVSDWTAENVASSFAKAFRSIIEEQADQIRDLNLFSKNNQLQVSEWNQGSFERIESCVHEIFAEQVSKQPTTSAICAWDAELTYAEVDNLSTRLAYHLISHGARPEVMIPVCFNKSAWTVVAMMAVLKSGAACVSLDPTHPAERLQTVIRQVRGETILAGTDVFHVLSDLVEETVVLGIDRAFVESLSAIASTVHSGVQSYNPAFVVYTSGSTGTPKGVVLEHAAIVTSAMAHGSALNITSESRILQFAAHVFDISIQDMFSTLMRGGCICIPSDADRVNDLSGAIRRMRVNWACITPTVASLIQPSDIPTLKTLVLAGEAVPQKVIDIWNGHVNLNNCYGPAESTIYCAWNGNVGKVGSSASNIGFGLSSLLWVTDVNNHHRLAPVGCIGELLVEGPLLARGYLNDHDRTAESFITNPAWAKAQVQPRRFYKTGDLVRYNNNGSLDYLGRKDSQVKIHGQRLELGELEHRLLADSAVDKALVLLPKDGPARQMLVAITSLIDNFDSTSIVQETSFDNSVHPFNLGSGSDLTIQILSNDLPASEKSRLSKQLATQVPKYMMPSVWIMVKSIPINTSGKLDRAKVARWIEGLDPESFQELVGMGIDEVTVGPTTTMEKTLQVIVARILNLSIEKVSLKRSFQDHGGDSITAMQVVSKARSEGLVWRVQDILGQDSLSELALLAKYSAGSLISRNDELEKAFDLSPIQQMHLELGGGKPSRFHQSFFLRLSKAIPQDELLRAVEIIVRQHSMLRARFIREEQHKWVQLISKDTKQSYRFRQHSMHHKDGISVALEDTHSCLNVETGPVFAADSFDVKGDGQFLFLVAHHLVIDLVSWRVILRDLEEVLTTGTLSSSTPFPFQAWARMQDAYAKESLNPEDTLPFEVPAADYAYWNMAGVQNVYEDTVRESFLADAETTALLLGSCQQALGTTPVELFMATLIQAFSQTFDDRSVPTIFSEGHGREPWVPEIDVSDTVGWFTTMAPFHLPVQNNTDIADILKRVKDSRRQLPSNGWPYFTSRFLNEAGKATFENHMPMEILFNYLGQYQQLERTDSLLKPEALGGNMASDVGLDVSRMALFEISVVISQGVTQFNFAYNRKMQKQEGISRWIRAWEHSLQAAATSLSTMNAQKTLNDFPLLSLDYAGLDVMLNERLPAAGIQDAAYVEDVYPASPMQEGLLLSQNRESGDYEVQVSFEVVASESAASINVKKLLTAWEHVVRRHAALRTIFIDSVSDQGIFDQVILKKFVPRITEVSCEDSQVSEILAEQKLITHGDNEPSHHVTLCQSTSGRVFCKLEINHAIMDAQSLSILQRDWTLAYENALPDTVGPLYSAYIKYLLSRPLRTAIKYWRNYMSNASPTIFPGLRENVDESKKLHTLNIEHNVPRNVLQDFCQKRNVTPANVIKFAWGLVLRSFTGSDDVCFGYLVNGRDADVEGVEEAVGPFISMLVCRINHAGGSLSASINQVQEDYLAALEYQHCSLAQIQHELNLSGKPLFNTIMSVQKGPSRSAGQKPAIAFHRIGTYDPTEVYNDRLYILELTDTTDSTTSPLML